MKRIAILAVLLFLVIAGAVFVYADEGHGHTRLSINPSEMKDGETKTLVDGDKTVTVKKNGDSVDIKIDGAGKSRTITINNAGGDISIFRDGGMAFRTLPAMPNRPRILIDGHEADGGHYFERHPQPAQTWFVCPKDHTMLRVPQDKADQTYKCPVDGTTMEKRKGRGFAFFFDTSHEDSL
jgi:hypothetical protein